MILICSYFQKNLQSWYSVDNQVPCDIWYLILCKQLIRVGVRARARFRDKSYIRVLATSDESSDIGKKQFDLMKFNFTVVLIYWALQVGSLEFPFKLQR